VTVPAFRRRADVLWRRSLDAVVVLPIDAEDPITVAGTGVDVWDLLDTWRTVEGIAELLAPRYDTAPDVIAGDVAVLVGRLHDGGALDLAAHGDGPTSG
jgi:Coenzyme PQQ synthesis protein D (PqqD)